MCAGAGEALWADGSQTENDVCQMAEAKWSQMGLGLKPQL